MSRNKKTEILIARFLTAVFLFVLISAPISVYAAGESASENESDEEYGSWSEALQDDKYTDNLAEVVAKYWATIWINYVGRGSDIVQDVSELIGDQYDNTKDLYENLYQYILPYSTQTVSTLNPSSLPDVGKPIVGKNNFKLISYTAGQLGDNLSTLIPNGQGNLFQTIATNKNKSGDSVTPDEFPSWFHIAMKYPANNLPFYPSDWNSQDLPCVLFVNPKAADWYSKYDLWYPVPNTYTYNMCFIKDTSTTYYAGYGCSYFNEQGRQVNSHSYILYTRDGNWIKDNYWITYEDGRSSNKYEGDVYYWGSGYITFQNNSQTRTYYWDNDTRTLYFLGAGRATSYFGTTESNDVIGNYTVNVINSVNIDDFTDLINQLMLDVNMSNTITNSLLLELLTELRNQRNNYVENDGDDIYNYIDYMMQKLLEVKDVHIEIPDISPDLGGIAEGLTALLNFLATIIRTIGGIVQSLLEGLVHLFVPSQEDWDDINIQFETLTAPFGWIKEFIAEGASNISLLLFGHNVTDFDIDIVIGEGSVDPDIVYDPNSGAPKIPVRFSNSSSEYFSCIEDAYIIDMSWYAPYKPVGDIIVVAFCWLMFIWRVFHDLPGIINGATGAFDQSPQDYSGYLQKEYASWKFFGRK